jgi:choline dehydrogenase-like flavoprotein
MIVMNYNVFDYVVVGAGSAGCVIAARLSEDPDVSVALVEAGPPDSAPEIRIPAAFGSLFKTRCDWDFDSEPESGLGGRRAYLPRGRMLGGSSSMNAMIYIRGSADYDEWAAAGAVGWSYRDVLPYFKRSEDNERGGDDYHAVGGALHVSDSRSMSPMIDAWIEAAAQAGHKLNADFNGVRQLGFGCYQLTQHNGLRCSTADAFLRPALQRKNLAVITDALVHRVVCDGERATGVEISTANSGGDGQRLHAAREVVLCAGAYGSPHQLLLSGVGPAAQLSGFGIPVIADVPVGGSPGPHAGTGELPERRGVADDRNESREPSGAARGAVPADLQHRRRRLRRDPQRQSPTRAGWTSASTASVSAAETACERPRTTRPRCSIG